MFVALRDLRFARGRFILIGSVVALITVLVGFLSGLTGGLASQNISAVLSIPADRLVFSAPSDGSTGASFSDSAITEREAAAWASARGVSAAKPIGISQTRAEHGTARVAIAAFGVKPGFDSSSPTTSGSLGLSASAAKDLGVTTGDKVTIAGSTYTVESVAGGLVVQPHPGGEDDPPRLAGLLEGHRKP